MDKRQLQILGKCLDDKTLSKMSNKQLEKYFENNFANLLISSYKNEGNVSEYANAEGYSLPSASNSNKINEVENGKN